MSSINSVMPSANRTAETLSTSGSSRQQRVGWLDRKLRDMLLSRLEGLRGRVEIIDADGSHSLGNDDRAPAESMTIHDAAFYRRLATAGSIGAGDSFVCGEWSSPDLVGLLRLFARNMESLTHADRGLASLGRWLARFGARLQRNTISGSRRNIAAHYDLGNEFFELFLDDSMMYSSACFDQPDSTLEQASRSKLDRICHRLRLEPADDVIEIGTGWGGFAQHAARNYGCRITTTTISPKQFEYAGRRVEEAGLADSVTLLQQDYRNLEGQYDKLVSIEMIEAVGRQFFDDYFRQCNRLLKPGGRMVIQSIVMPEQRYESYQNSVDFIQKYIFPGGFLPSIAAIQESVGRVTELRLVGVEDFSASYARTLHEWRARFFDRIDDVRRLGFSDEFIRTWDYYFSYCEAAFLERAVGVVQLEWVKAGNS